MGRVRSTIGLISICVVMSGASSAHARFLQVDPVGYQAGLNLYAYVHSDPIDLTDPAGLYSCGSSLSKGQCAAFLAGQQGAKTQITGAVVQISALRAHLTSGKLTAQDRAVAAVISGHLGEGAGTSDSILGQLVATAGKMLGMLNGNMPAENWPAGVPIPANYRNDYEHADPGQLTLLPRHWASSAIQQTETIAHASSHHGAFTVDFPGDAGRGQPSIQPYGHANISRMARIYGDPNFMVQEADAVTLSLGFQRDDGFR